MITVLLHHMATPAIMHQGTRTVGYVEMILRRLLRYRDTVTIVQVRVWYGGRARLLRGDCRHHREVESDRVL